MAIRYKGLGHVALRCKNLEQELRFYQEKLGLPTAFQLEDENGETQAVYLRVAKGQHIVLVPPTQAHPHEKYVGDNQKKDRSNFHACVEITGRHAVVEEVEGRRGIPVGRTPDDSVGMCKSHCLFVTDPEGNEWELMEFTNESMQLVCDR